MIWRILIFLAVLRSVLASEATDAIALGQSARADGVPRGAIYELKRVASKTGGKDEIGVLVELARCLIESDQEGEAVNWLERTTHHDEPEVIFWRAQARARQGSYDAALADYTAASKVDFPLREDAVLGCARMLEATGQLREALDAYASIPAGSSRHIAALLARAGILIKEGHRDGEAAKILDQATGGTRNEEDSRRYLQGRLALNAGHVEAAQRAYDGFLPHDGKLAAGAAIGRSDVLSRLHQNEKAESEIESFVRANPGSPLLGDLLAKLDEVRARQKDPSNATLRQWENDSDGNPMLSSYATYYLARGDERQERDARAIRNYREFIKEYPKHPLRTAAVVRSASLLVASGQTKAAMDVLSGGGDVSDGAAEARLKFLTASVQYLSGDDAGAAKTFVSSADQDPQISEPALANAALAAISGGHDALAAEILNALRKQNASAALQIELAEAFQSARSEKPDTAARLTELAGQEGTVGWKARLALAEWQWEQRNATQAQSEFRLISNPPTGDDQKDYFAVYLADDGSKQAVDSVANAAQDFLNRHPDSHREADVRMKWGEVLLRGGDYRGAQVQFEKAALATDNAALKQSALFLEARAAAGSMDPEEVDAAVQLLEQVASDKTSPLAPQARMEQAMLQSALHKPDESVRILDSLIAETTDPRLKVQAQIDKGKALVELGAKDKTQLQAAIQLFRTVASDPGSLPAERNEALSLAGGASEQSGDSEAALASYYEVLTAPRDKQPEYFWYYRAGSEAAQLLIQLHKFQEAAAIYEKMANAPGPRADEFKDHVKRLRLENFIWED